MKFAAPQWLWLLPLLPFLYFVMLGDQKMRMKRFESFAHRAVWQRIAPEMDWKAPLKKTRMWLLAMAFVLIALARPQWGAREETVKVTGLDVMIALDVSRSMEVEDVVPSRLKKAKHLIRSLSDRLQGDRIGVVAFAGGAHMACPLTSDIDFLLESVDILSPRTIVDQGTDIGLALETASRALDRGAEQNLNPGEQTDNAPPSRVVLLISDGEDQEDRAIEGAKKLKESGATLFVVGVGTEQGGPIPVRDESGQNFGFKKDRAGKSVVSTFRPDALMQVASAAGGRYWSSTSGEGEVEEILQAMGALNRSEFAERKYLIREERFQFPLAIAVILLLIEFSIPMRKLSTAALIAFLITTNAQASPFRSYLENGKGIKSYQDGKTDEARQHFGSAQALDPNLPEFQFNQGVVQMQQGDVDSAVQGFSGAANGALKKKDQELAAKSFFNLGSALTKKGDSRAAVQAYLSSLSALSTMEPGKQAENKELEADVRKNIELIAQSQQQKKQQSQSDKDKEKKDKDSENKKDQEQDPKKDQDKKSSGKNSADSKNDDDSKDPKKDKDGKDEKDQAQKEKHYEDPSKNRRRGEFKSQKLSKEDADRVMAELSHREKELQQKLQRQNQKAVANERDW